MTQMDPDMPDPEDDDRNDQPNVEAINPEEKKCCYIFIILLPFL